jgi:hypothetical protein
MVANTTRTWNVRVVLRSGVAIIRGFDTASLATRYADCVKEDDSVARVDCPAVVDSNE